MRYLKKLLAILLSALLLGLPQAVIFSASAGPAEVVVWDTFQPIYEVINGMGLQSQAYSDAITEVLRAGWAARAASIDVSAFKLTPTQFDALYWLNQYNCQTDAFDVKLSYSYGPPKGTYVDYVMPDYVSTSLSQREQMRAKIEAAANRVLATIPVGASDLEKVLAVNDYLALNCEYYVSGSGADAIYTAYGALVNQTAVCQGYSMAANYIFEYLGIESLYARSAVMGHGWNLVMVDGQWYHLDITWNDPLDDRLGYVRHLYFLRSAGAFNTPTAGMTLHYSWDAGLPDAVSTKYDGFFWINSSYRSAMVPNNGNWIFTNYISGGTRVLRQAPIPGGSPITDIAGAANYGTWPSNTSNGIWQIAPYLGKYGGKLFYNASTSLRYIDLNTMTDNAFTSYAPSLPGMERIYEMRIEGDFAHVRTAIYNNMDDPATYTIVKEEWVPLLPTGKKGVTGLNTPAQKAYALNVGATLPITGVSVTPSDAYDPTLNWNSLDSGIVKVSASGVLTGVAPGETWVVVSSANGAFAERFKVTVSPANVPVTGVAVSPSTASIQRGSTRQLTAAISPLNATNQNVTWSSSDNTVATVSATGLVTAVKVGTATITATSVANTSLKGTCAVTVTAIPPTSVTVDPASASIQKSQTKQLTANVLPAGADDKSVTWTSSDNAVATVSASGLVTAVKVGTATITATSVANTGLKGTCAVTVTAIPPASVTVDPASASIQKNQTRQLTANVLPAGADDKSVTWTSSDNAVATVSASGLVTAVKVGTATITATSVANTSLKGTCAVTVTAIPPASVTVDPASASIQKNQTRQLTANVLPAGADDKSVTWTSSDNAVATVSASGLVTAVKVGTATITATSVANTGLKGTCAVTVTAIPPASVTVDPSSASIQKSQTRQLTANVLPAGADDKSVTWTSSDNAVATVSASGLVTAVKVGTATITATSVANTSLKGTCAVTVTAIPPASVTVDPSSASIQKNQTRQLTANVLPAGADDKSVTWSSSDNTVATVSASGLVTAVKVGTATITATSVANTGLKGTCAVTVTAIPPASVTVDPASASIQKSQTRQLTANVLPAGADDKSVTWTSSDNAVATVSANGLVTAVKVGTATITATSVANTSLKGTCAVTVTAIPPASVTVDPSSASIQKSQTRQLTATVLPAGADDKSVTWTSSDNAVATVSANGLVTAVKVGTATITATSVANTSLKGTCAITVTAIPEGPARLSSGNGIIIIDEYQHYIYGFGPGVTWSDMVNNYLKIEGDGIAVPATQGETYVGTGFQLRFYPNPKVNQEDYIVYTFVLFGDTGDGWVNASDASECLNMIGTHPTEMTPQMFAMAFNNDSDLYAAPTADTRTIISNYAKGNAYFDFGDYAAMRYRVVKIWFEAHA